MNQMNAVSQMTGMPTGLKPKGKPIRRGGGRMKPKAPTTPQQHMANLQSQMQAGNHAAAKSSALHLAKALHLMTKPKPMPKPAAQPMPGQAAIAQPPMDNDADGM